MAAPVRVHASDNSMCSPIGISPVSQNRNKQLEKEIAMNWDQIEGKWKQLKGSAKTRWGQLTDDDFDMIDGKREELVGKIQERYGIAKEVAERQVNDWAASTQAAPPRQERKAG